VSDRSSIAGPDEPKEGEDAMSKVRSTTGGWAGFLAAALVLIWAAACGEKPSPAAGAVPRLAVKPGLEVFLEEQAGLVRGKRVGLITNPTGVDRDLRPDIESLRRRTDFRLVALYGPEHGVRGDAQAGEYVPFTTDPGSGLPVFSLYGQTMKPAPGMLRNIDAYMRSFDTSGEGKGLDKASVRDVEAMIFDIQDVGTRVYTYIATMAYAMEACAESGIPFIVLDRPNPIGGLAAEGPILEYPAFASFIGAYPIPLRHGLTVGELARLFNARFLWTKAQLTVVPMKNWTRGRYFDETGLPWVMPSPNMPTLDTAVVYPGQVMLEGTNVSEGRGTTRPFELFGAPWIDGSALAEALNALAIPGVTFREAWFSPTFSKFQGERCGGCQLHVLDRGAYRPVETALSIVQKVREMYPGKFAFDAHYFDRVMGTSRVREALETGRAVKDIVAAWAPGLEEFAALSRPYRLYK
jgi:uncharacterized protein YbbC (DUF1343 family)